MTMFRMLISTLILTTAAMYVTGCQSTEVDISGYEPPPPPPVTVKFIKRRKGTPPYRNYYFDITIKNPHEKPTWYVFRYNGEKKLNEDEIFKARSTNLMPFISHRIDGGKGKATRVVYDGKDKFIAFCVVGKATLHLESFRLIAQLNFNEFEVWEAKGIFVNSKTPLEDWLPYNVVSEADATIPEDCREIRLDLNRKGTKQRTDYPKQPVNHVWIQQADVWLLPIHY